MSFSFTNHINSINETYFQHMWYALKTSGLLMYLCLMSLVHAICPWWFVHTVSTKIMELDDKLSIRVMEGD